MTNEAIEGNEPDSPHNVGRRQLNVAVLAALAGGLGMGMASTAQAFPRSAKGQFNAASRILAPYGVTVGGDDASGHDRLDFEIAPLPNTEYTQVVGARNGLGEIEPHWMTSAYGKNASATHFHPGEIVPCVRTTIEQDALATHELFDSAQRGIVPCFTVESEMLDGGRFGTIRATHFHDGAIIPCIKTTIEGHSRAIHEVFDTTEGDIIPCIKVATEMLDRGALGRVEIAIDPDLTSVKVIVPGVTGVGAKTYELRGGALELVSDTTPR
jgi:hypothetical protein